MNDPWQRIRKQKGIDSESRAGIIEWYGNRGKKALDAADRRLVKKYRDFFVVTGSSGNYVVSDGVCTCRDFAFRQRPCWHIIAVGIAEAAGLFEPVDLWYQDIWKQ